MSIKGVQSAQQLKNHLRSINIEPERKPCTKTDLESFQDILKYEMRRCK